MAPSRNRGWWRSYFHDHPGYISKTPESKDSSGKAKVYCMLCFDARIVSENVFDESMVIAGTQNTVRSRQAVEDMVWAQGQNDRARGWLVSRTTTLICHLRDCERQSSSVRTQATTEAPSSPARPRPVINLLSNLPQMPSVPWLMTTEASGSRLTAPLPFQFASSSLSSVSSFSQSMYSPSTSGSVPSTRAPSPAFSEVTQSSRPSKRPHRSKSFLSVHQASFPGYDAGWSNGEQALFETAIARLTASAGLPFRWVENPEWISLCERFMPSAKSPSRKVLTQRLIPATLKTFKEAAKEQCRGLEGTVSYDGWTGDNHHHYIAFMVNCRGQNHVVRVHDASGERKTAENLYRELEKVIDELKDEWKIVIVAVCSDAGGEALKGCKMAVRARPDLVGPDCFAHQSGAEFLQFTDKATELIGWLRGKTYVLALLREVQLTNAQRVLAVIRAVLTRWTAHYLTYRRLLEIRISLQLLVENDEKLELRNQQLLLGDASARQQSRKNIAVIKNSAFWHALARIKNFLEPLTIASNITQADSAHVDIVLIMFAFLYIRYSKLSEAEDIKACDAILGSIEWRWLKTDQDVFIAGQGMQLSAEKEGTKLNPLEVWDGISHPNHPLTPLARLAHHILSICPNSASVERLWSVFGTILTKLRTRLGNAALLNLAELKLYLQEEHMQARSVQTRLKRTFGTALVEDPSSQTTSPTSNSTTTPVTPVSINMEPAATAEAPMAQDTPPPAHDSTPDSVSIQPPGMRGIIQELIEAVELDNEELPEPSTNALSIPIKDLFDFTQSYWVDSYSKLAMRGLQDELELYELLDLDAEGDTVDNEADEALNE